MSNTLRAFEEEAVRCIRCGACQSVCPVFKELQAESTVARGRVRLIRGVIENKLSITEGFVDKISTCLMCKACVANCPSGVKVDKLVEAARNEIIKQQKPSWISNLIFHLILKNRGIFNISLAAGSRFQGLLFRKGPGGQGMLPRIPLGIDRRRFLAPLASKTLRSMYPVSIKVSQPRLKAAFFTGCLINYIYTDTGIAVIEVLKRNGIDLVIPTRQHCCGTPARINGELEIAKKMARANIDELLKEDVDVVLTACGTCGLALKEEYRELLADDADYLGKAQRLGAKVKDFTELITDINCKEGNFDVKKGPLPLKVTYHDPCHLVRGLKIKEQPRQIIRSIPGIEFSEMEKPDACCGSGGSFSLKHYDLSQQINDRKIADIEQTRANIVVTGCSACRMHIDDGFNRMGIEKKSIHIAQLLYMSYEAAE